MIGLDNDPQPYATIIRNEKRTIEIRLIVLIQLRSLFGKKKIMIEIRREQHGDTPIM